MALRKRKKIRVHLTGGRDTELPSIEGYLVSRANLEFLVELPHLVVAAGREPVELASRHVAIPRERVAFYEVIG